MDHQDVIYLDHAASTPLAPEVLEAMLPYLGLRFGNPSAAHRLGREARAALEGARAVVAAAVNCRPAEVVFTSGGTESDNLAVRGAALAGRAAGRGAHIVVTAVEHEAVAGAVADLVARHGFHATVVGVDRHGRVAAEAVLQALRRDTVLVSVMLANNEVGTLQPVRELGGALRGREVTFHTDAVQAAAWLPVDVESLRVDLLSLSAHKLYGPKGVGALVVREDTGIFRLLAGGGQERGRRPGTPNVAGAVGLAAALRLAGAERDAVTRRVTALADELTARLTSWPGVHLTGHPQQRLPGIVSVAVEGARAEALLIGLDLAAICASSGSACTVADPEPSRVLLACGLDRELARGALRFSLGRGSTAADVRRVTRELRPVVDRARAAGTALLGGPERDPGH